MFISLFKKFTAFASQPSQEPSQDSVAKYGVERTCPSHPGLVSLFRGLDSVGDSRLKGPLAWSVSADGATLSTLWKKDSPGTRSLDSVVEEADRNTRLGLALQLVDLGALFPKEHVAFLEHASVYIEGNGRCGLDTRHSLYQRAFNPNHAIIFSSKEAFWFFAASLPGEQGMDLLLTHWVAVQVLRCLAPGHHPFKGHLLWGVQAFFQRLHGRQPSNEPAFRQPDSLPTALTAVLGKMLSFDPEQRYPSTEAALSALREALRSASTELAA